MNYNLIIDKITSKKIICFGASDAAKKLFKLMPLLKADLFIDNDVKKQGQLFLGKPVCTPNILNNINVLDYFIIITSSYKDEIKQQLQQLGLIENEHFCDSVEVKNSLNLNLLFENGHYYSPIPDIKEIREKENTIFSKNRTLTGIELNVQNQLEWFRSFKVHIDEFYQLIQTNKLQRYYIHNDFFEFFDAATLYSILNRIKPKKIIEIGSGFSSSVMLDSKDLLNLTTKLTFIEPFPDRLNSLLTENDKKETTIITSKVQEVSLDVFKELKSGDILFIDSSHVSKINSDINYLLFEVIPNLKPGVIIHFHDIFYPFEYPKEWIYKGYYWNEAYLLRSFLQYNDSFSMIYWNDFIYQNQLDELKGEYISVDQSFGGGLWLKKNN